MRRFSITLLALIVVFGGVAYIATHQERSVFNEARTSVKIATTTEEGTTTDILRPNPRPKLVIQNSGIKGQVTIGGCPAQREDTPCEWPYETSLELHRKDGTFVKYFSSDKNGAFTLNVQPGVYVIKQDAREQKMLPRTDLHEVSVKTGMYTEVKIEFDSGIR